MADPRDMIDRYPSPGQRDEVLAYIEHGVPLSDFLERVVCNDLFGAYGRADSTNTMFMQSIVIWWYNYAPHECRGSQKDYIAWKRRGGLNGHAPLEVANDG